MNDQVFHQQLKDAIKDKGIVHYDFSQMTGGIVSTNP